MTKIHPATKYPPKSNSIWLHSEQAFATLRRNLRFSKQSINAKTPKTSQFDRTEVIKTETR